MAARFGRFGETALWILVALREGPRNGARLLDDVRSLDGQIGPGTLYGAVARLERSSLIERTRIGDDRPAYRLTERGAATDRTAATGGASR